MSPTSRLPPGPSGSFLLGSTRALQRDQLGTYERAMRQHGDIAHFRVGPPKVGFEFDAVFTPEGARQVLATDAARYAKGAPVFAEFRHLLGNGLLTSNGERWRRHRRIAAPLFSRQHLVVHLDTIAQSSEDLVVWCSEESMASGPVDLHALSMRYALHVLGTVIFGEDIAGAAPILREVLPPLGEHAARRALAPLRSPHRWPSPANRRAERRRKVVWDLADGLIAKRAAGDRSRLDLLSLLLEARDPDTGEALSHDEVRDEALIFLIAGHETTGSTLAFTLHLLGRHPEVQDRVRDEVQAAGEDPSGTLNVEALPFTTAVVNESLRLYPSAHTVVRSAVEETEVLGYPVAEGGIVAVSIWAIHHRPDLWPEPDGFEPDRFTRSGVGHHAGGVKYSHLPFGGGPRSCIGEHLAMTELVVAVAALARRFRWEALLDVPPTEVDLSLRPHGVLPARLHPL